MVAGPLLSLLEVAAFTALLLSYIWGWQGAFPGSRETVMALGLSGVLASNFLLHKDPRSALGFRLDNWRRSIKEVMPVTLALALPLVVLGGILGTLRPLARETLGELPWLFSWAFLQQYALQGLVFTRLRQALRRPMAAAPAAAIIFALHHLPNPLLTAATLAAGWAWCWLFQRSPNLFTLTLSHVILTLALSRAFSPDWSGHLRVGPGYFEP